MTRNDRAGEPRYCIGAPLARLELQAVFSRLLPRFPGMRLAVPLEELTLNTGVLNGAWPGSR